MTARDEKTTAESFIPRPSSDIHDFYRKLMRGYRRQKDSDSYAQLLRVMKIMEAAFRSDELGAPVAIENDEIV